MKGALSRSHADDMAALCADLMAADDAADAQKLAAIAWRLYGEAGIDEAEIDRLHAVLLVPLRRAVTVVEMDLLFRDAVIGHVGVALGGHDR